MEKRIKKQTLNKGLSFCLNDLVVEEGYDTYVEISAKQNECHETGFSSDDLYCDYYRKKKGKRLSGLDELRDVIDRRLRMMEIVSDNILRELQGSHEGVEMEVNCSLGSDCGDRSVLVSVSFTSSRLETDKEFEARRKRSERAKSAKAKQIENNKKKELDQLARLRKKYPDA